MMTSICASAPAALLTITHLPFRVIGLTSE